MQDRRTVHMLPLFFLLMGAGSTVAQSVMFREFTVIFYGNELVLGYLLFAWLFSVALGAVLYRLVSCRISNSCRLFLWSVLVFAAAPVVLVPVIRISRQFAGVDYGMLIPFYKMALLSLALVLIPGMGVGFTFPLGCSIGRGKKGNLSFIYAVESGGALLGGLFFSFILVRVMPTFHCGVIVFAAMAGVVAWTGIDRWKGLVPDLAGGTLFLIVAVLVAASPGIDEASYRARWKTLVRGIPLLVQGDTPYRNLAIGRQEGQYPVYFNGVYGYAFPDPYGEAVAAHHVMTQAPKPDRVLILGEVSPGFIGEVLKHPVKKVTVIHLDPALSRLMAPYLTEQERKLLKDPRLEILHGDGRLFVDRIKDRYDLVRVAMPDPTSALLNRYYTLEFYTKVKSALTSRGVLAISVTSSENYLSGTILKYNQTIIKTLRQVFPAVVISPSSPALMFASKDRSSPTSVPAVLFRRYQSRKIKNTTFTPYLFETFYEPDRVKFFLGQTGDLSRVPVNSDIEPVAYLYGLKLWDRYSGSRLEPVINLVESGGMPPWYWVFGVIALLIGLFAVFSPNRQAGSSRASCGVVFGAGLCGMGFSLLILFTYQNLYGYLYQRIGFVTGLYMMGIFIGGMAARKVILAKRAGLFPLLLAGGVLSVLCAFIPALAAFLGENSCRGVWLLYLVMITGGVLAGLILPFAAALTSGQKQGPDSQVAAALWGADHLGGCIGALVLGAFLVPLLGVGPVSRFLAFVMAVSMVPIVYLVIHPRWDENSISERP